MMYKSNAENYALLIGQTWYFQAVACIS